MIRTIIVDDEVLSRIGIQSFLNNKADISVEGVFGMARDAIKFLEKQAVDIVLTDIEMADMNGLEFIKIIRERKLAAGIIIISCHDNFDYAREAITLGTDQYMLKHDITEPEILSAITAVYKKITTQGAILTKPNHLDQMEKQIEENGIYQIGVIKLLNPDSGEMIEKDQVEEGMLVQLLEEIVNGYHMGTLFAPYKKEIFIIFRFGLQMGALEREKSMEQYIKELQNNIMQYINKSIVVGISTFFSDLKEIPMRYNEAVRASEMSFYERDIAVFYSSQMVAQNKQIMEPNISLDKLLEANGVDLFRHEITNFLEDCKNKKVEVRYLKEMLSHYMSRIFYRILDEYSFSEDLTNKWNQYQTITVITSAENIEVLTSKLIEIITKFINMLHEELENDEFREIFRYINHNLTEKISLIDMANMKCMSVPSFCKRFKERTNLTLVQYINQSKIEKVKKHLKNQDYSLGQIADLAGFSNENYMVRVFKKVTGKTITDFRAGLLNK